MEFLLKASAITALFYFCYKLFLQGDTFFEYNRWFLLSGLILSVCVPFLVIPIYIENPTFSNFVIANSNDSAQPIIEESIDYLKILPILYGIGLIFFLTKLGVEFVSLFKIINNNKNKSSDSIKFIEVKDTVSPFSFFNYIVYNPKQFTDAELEHILNHEKVHARQWHSLDIILVQLATVAFWFNPVIWLYKKDLQQNLEFIADQNAQRVSSCQKSYQHLLLKATVSNQHLVLANNFYNSLIKKRIVMLHKSKSHKLNVLKYALVIPLLGIFLMSFNTKEIYVNPDTTNAFQDKGDVEIIILTKDFNDTDIEKIKKEFAALGVTLKFKSIKRNATGEIIAIKIDAKTSKSNVSFKTSSEEGICPIKIVYNSDGHNISIGSSNTDIDETHDFQFSSNNGNHKIVKSGSGSNVFIIAEKQEDHDGKEIVKHYKVRKLYDEDESIDIDKKHVVEVIIEDEDINNENIFIIKKSKDGKEMKEEIILNSDGTQTWVEDEGEGGNKENVYIIRKGKDGKEIKESINYNDDGNHSWIEVDTQDVQKKHEIILKGNNNKNGMIFISSDGNESPLILIDGKESTKEVMEKLSPDSIEKMNVLKGEKATSVYGEKGKEGVIIITTKKH